MEGYANRWQDCDLRVTAVYRIDEPVTGDCTLYLGSPDKQGTPIVDTLAVSPEAQRVLLAANGFTHVFCDTHWERGLITVDKFVNEQCSEK